MDPFTVWLIFCALVLALCLAWPEIGRIFVGLFFMAMALGINVVLALLQPELFVGLGTDAPVLEPYRWVFENVVALAPALLGLLTAAYEISISLLMLSSGRSVKWGLIGGIIFLIAITPVGTWTLASPIMALALAALLRRPYPRSMLDMLPGRPARRNTGKAA